LWLEALTCFPVFGPIFAGKFQFSGMGVIMILYLHRQGLTVSAIGRELKVDRKTVRK
jgi:hypothetical protein